MRSMFAMWQILAWVMPIQLAISFKVQFLSDVTWFI